MTDLTMPRLSDSMEEGTILRWLVEDGQPVAVGDDLVEIETDKATMAHSADAEGILEIVAPEGATLAVGSLIARVGSGEARSADDAGGAPSTAPAVAPAAAEAAPVPVAAGAGNGDGGTLATPLARRVAAAHDVQLEQLEGSGVRGRITRADVLAAAGVQTAPPRGVPSAAPAGDTGPTPTATPAQSAPASAPPRDPARGEVEVQAASRLQQVIARRMSESKATAPDFQVETEVAMDAVVALRGRLKAAAGEGELVPSLNDFIVKACASALRRHPRANGTYRDGAFELHGRVNIGVAVAAEDALVVPTVFDADTKTVGEIGRDVRALAENVRDGRVEPRQLEGGTFTVSNLGMYGMTAITPVLNGGQAGILGVGALRQVLVRHDDGEIVDAARMTLRLSCDHRILYGADAARFLADIRDLLEAPLRLAL